MSQVRVLVLAMINRRDQALNLDDEDPAGDTPKAEALRELLCFADSAADGVSAVLTRAGMIEMRKLARLIERRLVKERCSE